MASETWGDERETLINERDALLVELAISETRRQKAEQQRDALLSIAEDIIARELELRPIKSDIEDDTKTVAEYLDEYNDALFVAFMNLHKKAVAAVAKTRNFNC